MGWFHGPQTIEDTRAREGRLSAAFYDHLPSLPRSPPSYHPKAFALHPTVPFAPPMPPMRTTITQWMKSSIGRKSFYRLRQKVVIPDATNMFRWRVPPRTKVELRSEENEVVSFAYFHSFGIGVPAHPLLRWLLHYYGLRLHDLTP
jgi:hypothetical protein